MKITVHFKLNLLLQFNYELKMLSKFKLRRVFKRFLLCARFPILNFKLFQIDHLFRSSKLIII